VSSIGATIQSLDVGSNDAGVQFEDLKTGLQAPLTGMGTAFSSSLFGLTGAMIVGFLDLQAGQAQNHFYTELEDWPNPKWTIRRTSCRLETGLRRRGSRGSLRVVLCRACR
jgi:hypothetical protein